MQRVLHNSRYRDLDCWHTDLLSAKAVWLLPVMRRDICRHSYAVERGLVVGSCGQLLLVNFCGQLLLLPTLLSDSQVSISLVKHTWSLMNHFRTGKGPCRANLHKCSLTQSPSCDCGQWQTMNHIVDTCPLSKLRWTESAPRSGRWRSHMAGIYSNCSTCEIK